MLPIVSAFRKLFRFVYRWNSIFSIPNDILYHGNYSEVQKLKTRQAVKKFSIGIVTYNKRFEKFFKPLLAKIRESFAGDIVVCINGNHREKFDEIYRKNMLEFLRNFDRVYPMFFLDFRSLAKLWNNCVFNSKCDYILLLNDDLIIQNNIFWEDLKMAISQNKYKSFKLNNAWSHVFLNKAEVADIGWFDERLLGVGNEDLDFELRYYKKYGRRFPSIENIAGIDNKLDAENTVLHQKKIGGKYSAFNAKFFARKYKPVNKTDYKQVLPDLNQYASEKFYREHNNEL